MPTNKKNKGKKRNGNKARYNINPNNAITTISDNTTTDGAVYCEDMAAGKIEAWERFSHKLLRHMYLAQRLRPEEAEELEEKRDKISSFSEFDEGCFSWKVFLDWLESGAICSPRLIEPEMKKVLCSYPNGRKFVPYQDGLISADGATIIHDHNDEEEEEEEEEEHNVDNTPASLLTNGGLARLHVSQEAQEQSVVLQLIGKSTDNKTVFLSDGHVWDVCKCKAELRYLFYANVVPLYGLVKVEVWTLEERRAPRSGLPRSKVVIHYATAEQANPGVRLGSPRRYHGLRDPELPVATLEECCCFCNATHSPDHPLLCCSLCRDALYCSSDCIAKDTPRHREECSNVGVQRLFKAIEREDQNKIDRFSKSRTILRSQGQCSQCKKTAVMDSAKLVACDICNNTLYCSPECQASHEPQHKQLCSFVGWHRLITAIRHDNRPLVEELMKRDESLVHAVDRRHSSDADSGVVLRSKHSAAQECIDRRDLRMFDLVLQQRPANLDKPTVEVPIAGAALRGFDGLCPERAVLMCVMAGSDPNAKISDPEHNIETTLLHTFAKRGRAYVVECLLEYGANADSTDVNGQTALESAKAFMENTSNSPLVRAGFERSISVLERFSTTPQSLCSYCGESIGEHHRAFSLRCSACCETLYCNKSCQQAHETAHKSDCQELCLQKLVGAIRKNKTELVARHARPETVNALFLGGDRPRSPIHECIDSHNTDMLGILLEGGQADLNLCDGFGCTPLAVSLRTGNRRMVKALLVAGVNPNFTMHVKMDAVRFNSRQKERHHAKILKVSALFFAVKHADRGTTELLFKNGLDSKTLERDIQFVCGRTPKSLQQHFVVHGRLPDRRGDYWPSDKIRHVLLPLLDKYYKPDEAA